MKMNMTSNAQLPPLRALWGYARLLADIDTELFDDGIPEPWKGIGQRLRLVHPESRLDSIKTELNNVSGLNVDECLAAIATTDPTTEPNEDSGHEPGPASMPSVPPFPIHALPKVLGDLVTEGAKAIGCPADYIALPLLTCAGAAIGTSVCIELKGGWLEFGNLYTAVVGPSGTKKTPAKKLAVGPTIAKGLEYAREYERQLAEYDRAKKAFDHAIQEKRGGRWNDDKPLPEEPTRPILHRSWVSDTTVEALGVRLSENLRGLVLIRDELAALPSSMNQYKAGRGSDQQFFLSAWSHDPIQIDRKKDQDSLSVSQPFLAITGGMQPGILQNALGGSRLDDGFTPRFLFAYPDVPPQAVTDDIVDDVTRAAVECLFVQLFRITHHDPYSNPQQPQIVYLSPDARVAFVEWERANIARIEALSEEDPVRFPLSKMPGQLARIALILHAVRWVCKEANRFDELEPSTMRAAIQIVAYFVSHARRVWSRLVESKEDRQMRSVINWMAKRRVPASVREILRSGVGGLRSSAEVDAVVKRLLDCDLIAPLQIGRMIKYALKGNA